MNKNITCRKQNYILAVLFMTFISGCSTLPTDNQHGYDDKKNNASYEMFRLSEKAQQAYAESRLIEAAQLYQQIVEKVPTDADAWFRLANTYAQQGSYERAIHAYETSLTHDSQQPKAWFNLSTAHLLNAQAAMRQSYDRMRPNDPARALVDARLTALSKLLHGRLEESSVSTVRTAQ